MAAKKMQEFPPPGLTQLVRRQIPGSIHLHAGNSKPFRFQQSSAERQSHRFESYTDFHLCVSKLTAEDAEKRGGRVLVAASRTSLHRSATWMNITLFLRVSLRSSAVK